jgi:hypothetical protein
MGMAMKYAGNFATLAALLVLVLGTSNVQAQTVEDGTSPPDSIDYAMFYLSDVRDAAECDVTVQNGRIDFGAVVTNPAMTCPDAFAWSLFVRTVSGGFWENWSTDRQIWPNDPWPRCGPDGLTENCCPELGSSHDGSPEHCPVFPGGAEGFPSHQLQASSKAHSVSLANAAGSDDATWDDVPDALRAAVIGNIQDELIYRNEVMTQYLFDNELYFTDGLAAVFERNARATEAYAPYQAELIDPAVNHAVPAPITSIVFPISSVMVKINWIAASEAPTYGIDPYDTENPFITMNLVPQTGDEKDEPEPYIAVSFHISSKDTPNWFWTTFEHVANQGRCDWIGCNDSFGFETIQTITIDESVAAGLPPVARNYTPPNKLTTIDGRSLEAFDLAQTYLGVDRMTPELTTILDAFDIGTAGDVNTTGQPTQQDAAWRSYRLKGTQTDWVTSEGHETRLGNSVTEAGFVNTASCISCHARAAVNEDGLLIHAIFENSLSNAGIPQSPSGTPNPMLYSINQLWGLGGNFESLQIRSIQTDFVWGFRFSCPIEPLEFGPAWCNNVTGPGYSSPVPTVD